MRDYLKSLGSFSWAMSLFGLKNLGALMTFSGLRRRGTRAGENAAGLDAVTQAVTDNLGSLLKTIFHTGDRFFQGLVDLSFGRRRSAAARMPWLDMAPPGPESAPPASASAPSANVPPVSGWGPMPPIPDTPAPMATGAPPAPKKS